MQTRKTFGIVGEGKGKVHLGTNGQGKIQIEIHGFPRYTWTGPDLTAEEAIELAGKLTRAIACATEETWREHLDPETLMGYPCPLGRCDQHGPGGCFDPGILPRR